MLNVLLQCQAGCGVDLGIFHFQDQVLLLFPDGKNAPQQGHILRGQRDVFTHCLKIPPAGKIGEIIPEHKEVGDFTGHGHSLQIGVVEAVHTQGR